MIKFKVNKYDILKRLVISFFSVIFLKLFDGNSIYEIFKGNNLFNFLKLYYAYYIFLYILLKFM
jgi:hypothetical protein